MNKRSAIKQKNSAENSAEFLLIGYVYGKASKASTVFWIAALMLSSYCP